MGRGRSRLSSLTSDDSLDAWSSMIEHASMDGVGVFDPRVSSNNMLLGLEMEPIHDAYLSLYLSAGEW
jgi:hypothetical protein